ncbi:hypothetical protein A5780_01100 [Nocardia sp. 852002-20019_SCH5090214]|jgi:hypothetical protein|uniref:Uncharacterized protein n=1 Tax=Nocardia nova TaxID=37330 RepID=A0A2S6A3D4_9NOCA|nr:MULTISPECIES: hypothetical protein [Nocardia]OBF83018.1 hypothetical protein A9X06_18895 [Mycobacterium sp. 852002-51759_SCH5129042]MBF6246337.1 hypothetical protein [Nocardia elegans]MBF6278223.1 hypothetical protein [Nocardia nova]MBV7705871.1 hypothetical protein [Nocardia nova]OBA51772.1 hypothetical protein A5789_26980 [Nocardia sp. 852002-51101_SCH5132738]
MNLFGAIGKAAGWVGNQVVNHWDDIAIGALTGVAFATTGPIGAGLVGAAAGALQSGIKDGWSWKNVGAGAAFGAAGGMLGGGVSGFGVKGFMRAEGEAAAKAMAKAIAKADAKGAVKGQAIKDAMAFNKTGFWKNKLPTWAGAGHMTPGRYYSSALGASMGSSNAHFAWDMGKDAWTIIQGGKNGPGQIPVVDITPAEALKYV